MKELKIIQRENHKQKVCSTKESTEDKSKKHSRKSERF